MLAASIGKRNASIWHPSVCLSICPSVCLSCMTWKLWLRNAKSTCTTAYATIAYTCLVFHLHLALEKEAVVSVASDQTSSIETIEATSSNLPRNLSRRTSSSSSVEETAYWKLKSYSYVLPPIPYDCHGGAISTREASGMTSVEPQSDPGFYFNARPMEAATSSYSGLRSSTLEPPSAPLAYDKLAKHNYYNMNDVNNGTKSDEAVSDSGMFLKWAHQKQGQRPILGWDLPPLNHHQFHRPMINWPNLIITTFIHPLRPPYIYDEVNECDCYNIGNATSDGTCDKRPWFWEFH